MGEGKGGKGGGGGGERRWDSATCWQDGHDAARCASWSAVVAGSALLSQRRHTGPYRESWLPAGQRPRDGTEEPFLPRRGPALLVTVWCLPTHDTLCPPGPGSSAPATPGSSHPSIALGLGEAPRGRVPAEHPRGMRHTWHRPEAAKRDKGGLRGCQCPESDLGFLRPHTPCQAFLTSFSELTRVVHSRLPLQALCSLSCPGDGAWSPS